MTKKNNKKRIGELNYKIESLEPRMMMNADVVLEDFEDNISNVSTTVESALNEVDDLRLSGLGLNESLDSASAYFSGVGSNIRSLVSTAFENYRDALPDGTTSVPLAALVSGLNTNLPDQLPSNIGNPVFSAPNNDTLKLDFDVQNTLNASELELDEIGLGIDNASINLLATGRLSIEIDFDANDDGVWYENATDVELSARVESIGVSVPNVGASSSFMGLIVVETSLQDPTLDSADIAATYQNATTDVGLDLEFSLGANDGFPFEFVNASDVIKVSGSESGEFSVKMPSLQPKQGIGNFSLEHIFDNKVDFSQIPFIRNCDYEEVKISDIVGNLQEYWARASFAINGAAENGVLNLEKIGTYFGKLVEEKQSILGSLLEHLSLDDGNGYVMNLVGDGQNVLQNVALSTSNEAPTSLYLNITPTIANMATGTDELVNFGLLKLGNLNVDCSVRLKLDVHINSATGKLCFDSFNLDKFDLSISKDNINETISLGLFSATVTNGIFSLTASYDANNGSVFTAIPKFSVESATLKSGSMTVAKLDAAEDPYEFGYDSLTENWIVPDEIKAFASLSGETLSHQVAAYLQSMQTALRKQLEDNVKLDFLGSSIEKVADVVDKIDMVVNGFEDPSNSANNVVGLFVVDKGKYKANFSSVETFVEVFNNAWKKAFEINDDVCTLNYVGFVGDETTVIDDVENTIDSIKNNFKLDHYTFEFNLKFSNEVDFDLNLARSLGDGFANVATYGNVSAGCSAGISFSLDVKFDYQTINDGNGEGSATTLGDILGSSYTALNESYWSNSFDKLSFNETRTDVKLDNATTNFAFTFNIDDQIVMVHSGAIDTSIFKCVEKIQDKENEFVSSTATSLPKIEYNENIKKLIITSDNKFDIESSGNADAFSELKLVNTVQQTCFAITSDSNTSIVVSLKGVGNADNVDITLDPVLIQDFMNDLNDKGLSDSSDWKKCLDNYLSLQKSNENQFGLNEVLSTGSLEDGRSIKNTYGLYVVDINESTGEILFGCDPSLIKGYKTKRDGNEIKIDSDYYTLESNSGFKYMRMSGVLNASGSIGTQKGVLLEKYSQNSGYDSCYIDLSSITSSSDLQTRLDSFVNGAFIAKDVYVSEGVYEIGVGLTDSRYVDYWQNLKKLENNVDLSEIYRVTISDKFLEIDVGNDSVYVNTKNCSDLNDLARAIKDSLDVKTIQGVKSVVAQNNQIVFTTDGNTSLTWSDDTHSLLPLGSNDFKISGSSAPIDFESLNFDANTTVQTFVTAINTQLSATGVYLFYSETDPESHVTTYWDHFEFRSNTSFALENIGTSKFLEKLGFSALNASKCGDSDYRIVGRTLLGVDWSKLFNFTENTQVVLSADLTFSIEKDVKVGDTAPSLDQQNNTRTITLETPVQKNVFAVGGFIKNGDEYFKILELKAYGDDENLIDSVVVSNVAVVVSENIASSATWIANSTLKYVAAIDATFGFVDVNLVASGSVSANVKFVGQKNADSETLKENDSFLSNWNFSLDCDDDDFGGQFDVSGVVTGLGANTIYLGDNSVYVNLENYSPKVSCDFECLENAITDNFANLSNFSVQDVYALLEGLVQRLTAVAQNSDAKIPVINKSVGDLVNVANDIRDIVSKLRKDNIVSLQGLSNRLTKYLEDAGLVAAKNINTDASIFGIDVVDGSVVFDFNISKGFSAVHKFNFGGSGGGISGNADLKVEGDFWFSLSAEMSVGSSFDFILKDAIQFGANVNIVGQKLSFNLGIDGDGQTKGFDALLKNLITVGSDKGDSFVVGKAAFVGTFGQNDLSLLDWELLDEDDDPLPIPFEFAVPMSIFGNLPVSVCGYELGSIKFGKWNGSGIACGNNVNSVVEQALSDISAWLDTRVISADSSVNIVAEKTASGTAASSVNIKLILEDASAVDAGDLVVDFSEVYERIEDLAEGNLDWFDKIKLAVTGLNNLLDSLESSINSGMMSNIKDVPVVGSAVSGGVDFLSKLKQQVLEPFSDFVYESTGMTAEMVARKLNDLFGFYAQLTSDSTLLTKLSDAQEWHKEGNGVYYKQGSDFAEWFFTLGGTYSFGNNIGFDLGLPGLGLETDAGVDLSLVWMLNFGMKVSKDGGFQFIFYDENDVSVEIKTGLSGKVLGKMAGLGVELDLDSLEKSSNGSEYEKGVDLKFGLDIDHKSGGSDFVNVNLSEILGQLPTFTPTATVNMLLGLKVGVLSDVEGDAPKFPNIEGNFEFVWDNGEIKALGFRDFKLDMGSFIGGVLGPIVSKIQKVVEPLKPLIDFLTTPFPVLDDLGIEITPLSLAKEFSKGKFDDSMVYAIKDLIALSEKISAFGSKNLKIDLGSLALFGDEGDPNEAEKFLKGEKSSSEFGKLLDDANNGYLSSLDSVRSDASSALSGNGLQVGDGSWKFIWDEPTNIFKLLLGQDIDLVHYDMPKLSFDFDWDTFVRIWGPLGARIGVSFNASIDLAFGYDTLGIRQWVGSDYKDYGRLLNGFYVDDLDAKGYDKNELSFYGGLTAAAELNAGVSAGVGGGVGINVGFNLFDPNKDGKLRLNEIERVFKEEGLFGMFDVNGAITAKLYAYLDLLFYTKKWNITDDITLFEFNYEHTVKPVMISKSGDDVVANIGSNASSRVSTDNVNKTLDDGDETLILNINGNVVADNYNHKETVTGNGKLIINAEKGNDKIILKSEKPAEFDIEINGGDGDDIIDLSGLKVAAGHYVLINGGAGVDHITGAQGLNIIFGDTGTVRVDKEKDESEKDVYRLVAEANVDADKAGGDVILGGSGHDIIFGGAGDDKIAGGDSTDYIFGDGGSWSILTNKNDVVAALHEISNGLVKDNVRISRTDISLDGGKDTLIGGNGDDIIYGGGGDDHIDGGADNDEIYGEKGHDRIMGGSGNDIIHGGEGMDVIFGDRISNTPLDVAKPFAVDEGNETVAFSQEFIDAQFAKDGPDKYKIAQDEFEFNIEKLNENGSESTIHVSNTDSSEDNGSDIIYGDDGNDLLFGDDGSDTAVGGADKIFGGIGNDIIDGDGGADTISGGIDNDIIYGGLGDDVIDGGAGNDMLYGDNGIKDYVVKADDKTVDANKVYNDDGNDKIVFGDNLGLHGKIYANAKSQTTGGNDKITTGPGMDFVDGQGGSDVVTVNLMGESSVGYANVTDSGLDGSDTLVVEGTESDDNLLVRRNKNTQGEPDNLGFVAMLPTEPDPNNLSLNTNIERVNFTSAIETVNLNANGGNDTIAVDGTAKSTNINGGAGDDTILIGQLYNSERNDKTSASVRPVDSFRTQETNEEKYLSDGVSKGTTLNVDGDLGNDTFAALNNVGSLNMSGGKGDDKFSVYGFQDKNDKTIVRGAMSVDGGLGNDSMFVRGTNGDDTVIVSKEGMLSDIVSVKASGVETTTFDAAAGDDLFNVIGNNKGEITNLNGGKGNDTFSMGGLDADHTLRSSNTDGQSCDIKYELLDSKNNVLESKTESYTLYDTSSEPVVFVSSEENSIRLPEITLSEGSNGVGVAFFYVHYAGDLLNGQSVGTVKVNLSAPMLSAKALKSGAREIMLAEVSGSDTDFSSNWNLCSTLPVELNSSKKFAKIAVCLFADALEESESLKSITISSECDNVALTKSVSSLPIKISADGAVSRSADGLLAEAEEFVVSGNSVQLGAIANDLELSKISAYVVGVPGFLKQQTKAEFEAASNKTDLYYIENGVLHLGSALTDKKLVVLYRASSLRIDGSKAHLAYDDVDASRIKIEYKADGSTTASEILARGAADVEGVTYVAGVEYELQGDTIVFYNSINGRMMTLHGKLTVSAKSASEMNVFLPPESDLPASVPAVVDTAPGIQIEEHSTILAESGSLSSVTYTVSFRGNFDGRSSVKVRISVLDAVSSVNQDGTYNVTKEMQFVDANGNVDSTTNGEYIELTFTPENANLAQTVRLRAKTDTISEEYGFVTVHKTEKNLIDDIDGAVYAFGMGQSVELDAENPSMLSYAHKVVDKTNYVDANTLNEKNDYSSDKLFSFVSATGNKLVITLESANSVLTGLGINLSDSHSFEGKTIRLVASSPDGIVVGEGDDKKTYKESDWFKIISCVADNNRYTLTLNESVSVFDETNSSVLFSGSKDYLFIDENASVDRLFVNNQGDEGDKTSSLNSFAVRNGKLSSEEKTELGALADSIEQNIQNAEGTVMNFDEHAVRFEHNDIGKRGITAVQMEYAEYNLGTGSDTVNINKTLYREDGFQTFTVVNTGSGATGGDSTDDTVNVNSYAEETATVIASGTSAILSEPADNGGVTYSYTLAGSAEALVEAMGALDESEKIYVDAMLSDGTTQRREVTALEVAYFTIDCAFSLVSGVTVDTVSFKHGYSGDGLLVVNAQGGDDKINATSNNVTRNDMVVFGGLGDDTINMNRGGIAFGDRGQVLYGEDAEHPVTVLGSTDSGLDYTTGISKNHGDDTESNGPVHRLQTDGVRRGAYEIRSMNDDEGGVDIINVGGTDSVVIGGAAGDTITVSGSNNIALGDNGSVKYYNATNMGAVYGDSLNLGLHTVETTSDSVGDVDTVTISGDKNVAMGGAKSDSIHISGSDNVAIGDGGRYTVTSERLYAESKNEGEGGKDYISTGDGKNAIIGGTDKDTIRTGTGNDAIVGDGGKVIMDLDRNALMVTNEGFNVGEDLGTAGADDIDAGDGDNVIFGGLGNDDIRTGRGKDVVFGDNGFATFRGNASEALSQVHDTQAVPEIRNEATLSFNFVGNSQTGVPSDSETEAFGADGFAAKNWNNIGGTLSGTYGNDDREIVRFDDGTRASAVSVSYGGIERHRTTGTDNRINLQGYSHNFANSSTDANAALMNSGLMTTAPNSQNENKLEVSVDGLAQYFTHYSVIVYLDLPDSHSADTSSIRKVSLFLEDEISPVTSYFVNDAANHNFNGSYDRGTATSAELATSANYVVFDVAAGTSIDRFRVVIEEAFPGQSPNGKNLPGIAAIQVNGSLHAQDVAASSDIAHGGDDTISTGGGDDIVVGGTGGDKITTYGDERYGIYDNDVVFGDNAKMVFTDRDNSGATASMLSMAESLDSRDIEGNYADRIITGNGNDVVVGGLGADYIDSGATADADSMLDGIKVVSFNFTRENATAVEMVAGETAGVVADNDWTNLYIKNNRLHIVGENENNSDTPVKHDGVGISLVAYDTAVGNGTQNSSLMLKDDAQLDGDTSNSRLFNAYYAAQQQQEIKLTLTGLDTFRTGSELGASAACDVYVYLGGDQQGVDSYNYLFDVCGRQPGGNALDQHYYLNDWTGNHFDGDYRQVTCSVSPTKEDLLSQVAPDMSLIGNYVVFRNVTSATFEVRIRNLFTDTNQWPLNLPVITAVQVVAVADRKDDIAVGGDHDKDLVFGDDARVTFDIDLPFARNENQADYANRAVEAQSIHIDGNAVEIPLDGDGKPVKMGDTILTGRDRDVIVGGDFGDTITMGDGDDVAIGDNASIILEHNNPIGVFAPSVEIMLEQHSVNTSNGEVFLGNDNTQASQIQSKFENGGVPGVSLEASTNGGTDTFTDATGKDWTLQQETSSTTESGTGGSTTDSGTGGSTTDSGTGDSTTDSGTGDSTTDSGTSDSTTDSGTGDSTTDSGTGGSTTDSGTGDSTTDSGTEDDTTSDITVDLFYIEEPLQIQAGTKLHIVCTGIVPNPWWRPYVVIFPAGSSLPQLRYLTEDGTPGEIIQPENNEYRILIPEVSNGEVSPVIHVVGDGNGLINATMG